MAHAEPFPFVPPTVNTGKRGARLSAALTAAARASPISIARGCTRSMCVSQCSSGCIADITRSSRRRHLEQQVQQMRDLVAHLPAVHDHVDGAVLEQELGALKAFR